MKNLLMLASLVFSAQAFSAQDPIAFNQLILKKDLANPYFVTFSANRTVKTWCTGFGSAISFGSFEAAQTVDTLADGLYSCEGKFAQLPGELRNGIQIFDIANCKVVTDVELKADCPKPTKP